MSRRDGAPLDMAVVDEDRCSAWRRTTPSTPTAPATTAAGCTATAATSALQHHGRTQLAPTSGAMGYGVPAAVAAALLHPERTVVNIAGDGDFLMTGQELATATGYGAQAPDQHRRRQRHLRHDPHAPGARLSGPRQRQRPVQPGLRGAGARLRLARRTSSTRTEQFEAAFAAALAAQQPTLIHLKLDTDVSTTRTTLERDPRRGDEARLISSCRGSTRARAGGRLDPEDIDELKVES